MGSAPSTFCPVVLAMLVALLAGPQTQATPKKGAPDAGALKPGGQGAPEDAPGAAGRGRAPGSGKVIQHWMNRGDPSPLETSEFLDLRLEYRQETIKVLSAKKGRFKGGKTLLPRFDGRFSARLMADARLLDVVRFNFPITGGSGERTRLADPLSLSLARGASARITVRVPFTREISAILLADSRSQGTVQVPLESLPPRAELPPAPDLRGATFAPRDPPPGPPEEKAPQRPPERKKSSGKR